MNPLTVVLTAVIVVGVSIIALIMYVVVKFSEPAEHDETFEEYYDN